MKQTLTATTDTGICFIRELYESMWLVSFQIFWERLEGKHCTYCHYEGDDVKFRGDIGKRLCEQCYLGALDLKQEER